MLELELGLVLDELASEPPLDPIGVTRATGRRNESIGAHVLIMHGGVETVDVLGLAETRDILTSGGGRRLRRRPETERRGPELE